MTGRIHLKNMEFRGRHGCHASERAAGQPFLVDLFLTFDLSAAAARDDLSATVDYQEVQRACRRIMEGPPKRLLETLCVKIAGAVFRGWPQVSRVEVKIKKPEAPMPGKLEYVAVEFASERGDRLPRARR